MGGLQQVFLAGSDSQRQGSPTSTQDRGRNFQFRPLRAWEFLPRVAPLRYTRRRRYCNPSNALRIHQTARKLISSRMIAAPASKGILNSIPNQQHHEQENPPKGRNILLGSLWLLTVSALQLSTCCFYLLPGRLNGFKVLFILGKLDHSALTCKHA